MSIPYRKEIDGLRALAVLPVVLFHAKLGPFPGGFVGVDIFFVISGYLITSLILAQLASGTFSIVNFYEKRARRIFPALFFILFVTTVIGLFIYLPGQFFGYAQGLVATLLFISNVYFWKTSGYFAPSAELNPLLHTWSLSVEEQFYLFIPVLLIVAHRKGMRWITTLLIGLAICSLTLNLWLIDTKSSACFYLLPTRAWELLLGSLTALITAKPTLPVRQAASSTGLALICFSIFGFSAATPFPSAYALVPTLGAVLVITSGYNDTWVGRLLGNKAVVAVGLISYSLYLWHQPVFAYARIWIGADLSELIKLQLVALSVLLAYGTWRFIERPFRDLNRVPKNVIVRLSIASVGLLGGLGIIALITQGFLFRYSAEDRSIAGQEHNAQVRYALHRFEQVLDSPFTKVQPNREASKKKVLLIGDSFAQDTLNAVHEAGLAREIEFSTWHIFAACGNLFIEPTKLLEHIPGDFHANCRKSNLFTNQTLRKRMAEADEIWFASSWSDWQATLAAESITNLQAIYKKRLIFFGTKSFGDVDARRLLKLPPAQRIEQRAPIKVERLKINEQLKRSAARATFIDTQSMLCGAPTETCTQVTSAGELKSFDGEHLTQAGARLLGLGLIQDGQIVRSANNRTTPK